MELVASKWGVSKTFDLPLITYGATDFVAGVTLATGDVKISKDNGAFVNIATLPTINGAWIEVTLSATEMEADRIKVQIIDQTATKVFEDTGAILNTVLEATVAKESTLSTHETNRATMETTLVAEHDTTQTSVNLVQNSVDNIVGGVLRIQTSLVNQVITPSGDNWVKVLVLISDNFGALFDPADIVDPSGNPIYNGVGAKFSDIDDNQVVMYKDNLGTPLDTVAVCQHAPQDNKPQILERDAHGLYYYWMNATATGNALPIGQLKTLFAFFDITQTDATYSGTTPFLIQDTDPTSHLHILFSVTVSTDNGTNERLDDIIDDIANHEAARDTMQTRIEGTNYDPDQNSLKNIKDTIG